MTQCHVPEDLNPKILVSWDVLPCSLVNRVMKHWPQLVTKLHGVTHQNMALFIFTAVKTHNFIENGGNQVSGEKIRHTVVCERK